MSNEKDDTPETNELDSKPTITIAEGQAPATEGDAKPTITIAEKDGGK